MDECANMSRLMFRGVGALLLAGLVARPVMAASGNFTEPQRARFSFESAGKKILVDRYAPTAPPSGRAIVVLHGAGGMLFDGPRMRRVARALAAAGNTVYLLHYFNLTGTIFATSDAKMNAHFDDWVQTVREGIAWVHARENDESRPIGIYGYSLGGFLAIAAASNNPLVGAVTEQAGGIWNLDDKLRVANMPPVLMVHGLVDERVSFEKHAKFLVRVLRARGGRVETHFVPGEGHVFSETAMKIVREKAAEFFARELPSHAVRPGRLQK